MGGMTKLVRKLHSNQFLNVLNLNENYIINSIAIELESYSMNNIFIEEIMLHRNKLVHASTIDKIEEDCRMNVLIKEYILPNLDKIDPNSAQLSTLGKNPSCHNYDVRSLRFVDSFLFTSDFIFKFAKINNNELQSLTLKHITTDHEMTNLAIYLNNVDIKLIEFHLIGCNIGLRQFEDVLSALPNMKKL